MIDKPLDAVSAWAGICRLAEDGDVAALPGVDLTPAGWTAVRPVEAEAAWLMDLYLPILPPQAVEGAVIGQLGQSLDGRIATETGHSHYVTGEANRRHLHRLRALCDVVVVGAATALADDPRLTVRMCSGRNPIRVILDSRGDLCAGLTAFTNRAAPTWVVTPWPETAPAGADAVLPVSATTPEAILAGLKARGVRRVLIEGGGRTVSQFLHAGALDRLHVGVAPLLIGSGRPSLSLPAIATLDQAYRPRMRRFDMPPDTLFDCDLRGS